MDAVPPGAFFQALKGVYGINDAPNLWGGRHASGMLQNGATESTLAPRTLFWRLDRKHCQHERVPLIGMVGTHVDDDLFAGNEWWTVHVLPALRKTFAYTKWQDGLTPYVHLGRRVSQARNRIILDHRKSMRSA